MDKELASLSAHIESAKYRLLTLIGTFDQAQGWARQGFLSCAHYLGFRIGLGKGTAREHVRVARALPKLPAIAGAMQCGEVSFSKVRALTRVATRQNEQDLLAIARAGTAAHVEKTVRAMRRAQNGAETEDAKAQQASRSLQLLLNEDGTLDIRAHLPAELGAVVQKALERALEQQERQVQRSESEEKLPASTHGQRMADALVAVADSALSAEIARGVPAERVQVVVHMAPARQTPLLADVSAETPASTEAPNRAPKQAPLQAVIEPGGAGLASETARRLACDASVVVQTDSACSCGGSSSAGRKRRVPNLALRRVLEHRDGACVFPGCTNERHLHAHHIQHWIDGGETTAQNTCLVCSRHHLLVHEGGFRLERDTDGALVFFDPSGQRLPDTPELLHSDDGSKALFAFAKAEDRHIDEHTMPTWQGEKMDVDWACTLFPSPGGVAKPSTA